MASDTKFPQALWDSPTVSDYLGIPVGTLDQWAYLKKGPAYVKCGRHRRYRPSDVEHWLDEQTRGGPS